MTAPVAPWRSQPVITLVTRIAAGVGLIGVAVHQASGKATVAAQIQWANWGVVGLVVVGVANGLWLLAVRRAIGARARSLFDELARVETVLPPARRAAASGAAAGRGGRADALVAARNMTRFHRRACPLAAGKTVRPATRAVHERAGRRPCGVCQPVTTTSAESESQA